MLASSALDTFSADKVSPFGPANEGQVCVRVGGARVRACVHLRGSSQKLPHAPPAAPQDAKNGATICLQSDTLGFLPQRAYQTELDGSSSCIRYLFVNDVEKRKTTSVRLRVFVVTPQLASAPPIGPRWVLLSLS